MGEPLTVTASGYRPSFSAGTEAGLGQAVAYRVESVRLRFFVFDIFLNLSSIKQDV